MYDKNKQTKGLRNWIEEISFKSQFFLKILPRAIFRTQSKVYGGGFLQKKVNNF